MAKFVLTKESKKDLRSIAYYTNKKWGMDQRKKYLHRLRECFKILADSPQLGRKCPELKNTPFKYHEGRHLIFYRPTEKGIEIIRVLHDAMDIPRHFK